MTAGALASRPVAVIGGGIGGLTAALALARRGARVEVHEQAPALTEVGAGIQLSPNAVRALDALGLRGALDAAALRNRAVQLNDATGRRVLRMDLAAHRPDARFLMIHRAALIALLADAARDAGVTLHLGRAVDGLPDAPLIIAADGLRSPRRAILNGVEVPFFTHHIAWRAVIDDNFQAAPEAQVFMAPGRHLVTYPLQGGRRNLVAVQESHDWQDEGWSRPGDAKDLRRSFADLGGPVPGWLDRVGRVNLWGLFRHEVARVWHDDRLALLGDAAHPTLPFLAQGAGMAIEDAWILADCLDRDPDQPRALARYQAARAPRVGRIVAAANANARNYHLSGARRLVGHAVLRVADRVAPSFMPGRFDWLYDFDPTA
ncbi:FAD-binding protein [Paracoccus aestuarii]|uniref:FAD-binding protein n=1 Tax=Paracoccus aestuarii TaxID=453842 RepID=A0A418ZPQ9_9RHOB|nr:FAD-dependent monooxygenase [Paracoccus aestuarii]RJK96670.1 FAD-binding protein [Paracoccus aestuarii]WCQ98170.1 FAD-dependent monooxygenase [Paracoccus aestuarii]